MIFRDKQRKFSASFEHHQKGDVFTSGSGMRYVWDGESWNKDRRLAWISDAK